MNKKSAGLLFGAAVGAGFVWLVRQGVLELFERKRQIRVDKKGNTWRVYEKPIGVWLFSNEKVTWEVTNDNQSEDVKVSLANWREERGGDDAAVDSDPDPDDPDDPPQEGLSRVVPAGHKRKIRAKAKLAAYPFQTFEYDVYLNDQPAADPIVKLVL